MKVLNKESTERLREETTLQLSETIGALLRAAVKAHAAHVMSEIDLVRDSAALDGELDGVATQLQRASECLRKAQSSWKVVVERAQKKK